MRPPTVDQLRNDIDHGRTGDKVSWPDPAVAPLGTDEEAAGTPIPGNAVEAARAIELACGLQSASKPDRPSEVVLAFLGIIVLLAIATLVCLIILGPASP